MERPPFHGDPSAYLQAFGHLERLGVAWPWLRALEAAPWSGELDDWTKAELSERLSRYRFLSALAEEEMSYSLSILASARIPVALLGGAGSAFDYPDPQIRTVRSIEMLVAPGAFASALRALGSRGYRVAARRSPERLELARSARGMRVKLRSKLRPEETDRESMLIWSRGRDRVLPSICARVAELAPEDRIAQLLLVSLEKHLWLSSPQASNDLYFALRRSPEIRWDEIQNALRARGAVPGAWAILHFLHHRWSAPAALPALSALPEVLAKWGREVSPFKRRVFSRIDPPASWLLDESQYFETHFTPWRALKLGLGLGA